jgi:hypothetical protein
VSQTNESDAGITVHAEQINDLRSLAEALTGLFGYDGAIVVIGDAEGCSFGLHGLKPYHINQIAEVIADIGANQGRNIVQEYMNANPEWVMPEQAADLPQELADALGRPTHAVDARGVNAINITGMSEEQIAEVLETAIANAEPDCRHPR